MKAEQASHCIAGPDVLFIDFPQSFVFPEPNWCLGFRYMISTLREEGFSAALLHPSTIPGQPVRQRLIADILSAQASIVGFTTYDLSLSALLDFIKELRRAGLRSHVTLGGLCASAVPEEILKNSRAVDSVVVGEGEYAIVELARYLIRKEKTLPIPGVWLRGTGLGSNGLVKGEARPLIADLDEVPEPALDHLNAAEENSPVHFVNGCAPVLASKGCYGRCTFCSIQRFYRSCPGKLWRGREAGRIAAEVEKLTRLTGLRKVTFIDENFMGPGKAGQQHAREVAAALKERGLPIQFNFGCRASDISAETIRMLKQAGLAAVTLGIESMAAEALQLFNKMTTPQMNIAAIDLLEKEQIYTEITFIFFHPLSTIAEIQENLRFVERVRQSQYAYFNNNQPFTGFIPFFGTELTGHFQRLGLVTRDLKGYTVRYTDPRVGFIAHRMLAFPSEALARLANALPAGKSTQVADMQAKIRAYRLYLSMERLPALAADLCDQFERGASVKSDGVRAAAAAIDAEEQKVRAILSQFIKHIR